MGRGLQAHDDADRPRAHLGVGRAAGLAHAMDLVERLAPQLGLRRRPAPAGRRAAGRPAPPRPRSASNSPGPKSELTCSTPRPARFMPVAMPNSSASRALSEGVKRPSARLVLGGARRREAHGAGAQRLLGEARHLLDLALVRHLVMVGAALAHDVEAQRAVRQLRRHVDRAAHRSRAHRDIAGRTPSRTSRPRSAPCRGCPRRLPSG